MAAGGASSCLCEPMETAQSLGDHTHDHNNTRPPTKKHLAFVSDHFFFSQWGRLQRHNVKAQAGVVHTAYNVVR